MLQEGTITVENGESLDFKRKSTHKVTPGTKWDDSSGTPIDNIQALSDVIREDGKRPVKTLIFGSAAWASFISNPQVTAYFDKYHIEPGKLAPVRVFDSTTWWGRVWFGDVQVDLYIYNNFFTNSSGVTTPYVDTDNVILIGEDARIDLVYGLTEVHAKTAEEYRRMGLPSMPENKIMPYLYYKDSGDPIVGVQAAPLAIPTAIDCMGVLYGVNT